MTPEIPPPYVRSRTTRKKIRYFLMEPTGEGFGQGIHIEHPMGYFREPREALKSLRSLLADRVAWSATSTDPVELAQVEATRARVEALAVAVVKYEAHRDRGRD
jgi:hypothetical protein